MSKQNEGQEDPWAKATSTDEVPSPIFNWKIFFQLPLWLLLLGIIPFAFFAKFIGDAPVIFYSESRPDIVELGDTVLDFGKDPDGTPTKPGQNLNSTFSSLGVSFAHGIPDHLPKRQNEVPNYQVAILSGIEQALSEVPKIATHNSNDEAERRNSFKELPHNFIGRTRYRFRKNLPDNLLGSAICPHKTEGEYTSTCEGGITTVCIHRENEPKQFSGVHRIGFLIGYLESPHTVEVRCYSPSGEFLARQSNFSVGPTVFMGFKSKRAIGWIEIETIGSDESYSIGSLSFGD